jgi:hypothetical protein
MCLSLDEKNRRTAEQMLSSKNVERTIEILAGAAARQAGRIASDGGQNLKSSDGTTIIGSLLKGG